MSSLIVRVERNGRGFFRPSNRKIQKFEWYSNLCIRHINFNLPEEDGLDLYLGDLEWFCGYKSLEDLSAWINPLELKRLINYGFKVYLIEACNVQEGEDQVIFTKESVVGKRDITASFLQHVEIQSLNIGDFFKLTEGSKKVWIRNKYCRINKAYECTNFDDISDFKYLKKGKEVFIDFEF